MKRIPLKIWITSLKTILLSIRIKKFIPKLITSSSHIQLKRKKFKLIDKYISGKENLSWQLKSIFNKWLFKIISSPVCQLSTVWLLIKINSNRYHHLLWNQMHRLRIIVQFWHKEKVRNMIEEMSHMVFFCPMSKKVNTNDTKDTRSQKQWEMKDLFQYMSKMWFKRTHLVI